MDKDDWVIRSVSTMTRIQINKKRENEEIKRYHHQLVSSREVDLNRQSGLMIKLLTEHCAIIKIRNDEKNSVDSKIRNWVLHKILDDVFYGVFAMGITNEKDPKDARKNIYSIGIHFSDLRDYEAFEQDVLFASKLAQE